MMNRHDHSHIRSQLTGRMRIAALALALAAGGCATTTIPAGPVNGARPMFAAQRSGVVDAYVITFAAQPDPVVFRNEATLARDILSVRYSGGLERSVALVDASGPNSATKLGLMAAIESAGATLDPEEDVLVLYLSGHGRRGGRLQLAHEDGLKDELRVSELAAALDAAGVGPAVIIVSACFSGGFVSALAQRDRVILTAARNDRSSFGCRASDRLSYFGEAFLVDNVGDDVSLRAAHDAAKDRIRRLEREQGKKRSYPQRDIGVDGLARIEAARRR